jgi:peptide/nickel transport system substrate-binding protein
MGLTRPTWKVVNRYTFEITTPKPNVLNLFELTHQKFALGWDSTEAKTHATASDPWATKWLATHEVGFGPYTLTSYQPGNQVVLTAFPNYYGPKPYFKTLIFRQVPSGSSRSELVETGAVDVAENVPYSSLAKLRNSSTVRIYSIGGDTLTRVAIGEDVKPFGDVRARQALAYATPINQILKSVYFGFGGALRSPAVPGFPGYDPSFWHYQYDPTKAKALLKAAGVTGTVNMTLSYDIASDEQATIGEILKTAWAPVGINLTLKGEPDATFFSSTLGGKFTNYFIETFPFIPDVGYGLTITYPCHAPFNATHYCDKQVDADIANGIATFNSSKRLATYKHVQKLIVDDVPELLIATPGFQLVTNPKLQGVNWNTANGPLWAQMSMK